MANDQNTTGYATTCPTHLEIWRKNAARAEADDRFTVIFNEMVEVYRSIPIFGPDPTGRGHFCDGLVKAYSLITGETEAAVVGQVARAAQRAVAS